MNQLINLIKLQHKYPQFIIADIVEWNTILSFLGIIFV